MYIHPHRGPAGNDGGSRDLWPGREVTQRLIYFTGVPPPPASSPLSLSLSLSLLASTISTTGASPWGTVRGPRGASSRHCATYTTGQPPLHAATSYLHEKGVDPLLPPPPFPPRFIPGSNVSSRDPVTIPHKAPLDAPSSVNTVHHYRRGAYISKGTALASLRLSPVTLDTILLLLLLLFCRISLLFISGYYSGIILGVANNFYLRFFLSRGNLGNNGEFWNEFLRV